MAWPAAAALSPCVLAKLAKAVVAPSPALSWRSKNNFRISGDGGVQIELI
eukprot:COSAG02_NODE_38243_length_431_cov_1.021084_1_plen_49_part_10